MPPIRIRATPHALTPQELAALNAARCHEGVEPWPTLETVTAALEDGDPPAATLVRWLAHPDERVLVALADHAHRVGGMPGHDLLGRAAVEAARRARESGASWTPALERVAWVDRDISGTCATYREVRRRLRALASNFDGADAAALAELVALRSDAARAWIAESATAMSDVQFQALANAGLGVQLIVNAALWTAPNDVRGQVMIYVISSRYLQERPPALATVATVLPRLLTVLPPRVGAPPLEFLRALMRAYHDAIVEGRYGDDEFRTNLESRIVRYLAECVRPYVGTDTGGELLAVLLTSPSEQAKLAALALLAPDLEPGAA